MTQRDPRRRHDPADRTRYPESAHPERTVDDLERRVLGHQHDQVREDPDEDAQATEPP